MAMNVNSLNAMEAELPPGFRFHPSDEEIIRSYLSKKLVPENNILSMIDVDLNRVEPWDLPDVVKHVKGIEWYFYSPRDRKYAIGQRNSKATEAGYWKATGKDRHVRRKEVPHQNEKIEQRGKGIEWYLYGPGDQKYEIGQRNNKATEPEYWRATGKGRHVRRNEVPHRNEKNSCVLPRKGSRWHHHSCKILR